jgi:hypothetical protein
MSLNKNGFVQKHNNGEERRTTKTLTLTLRDGEELSKEVVMDRILEEQLALDEKYEHEQIDFQYVETHGVVNGTLINLGEISSLSNIVVHGARLKYFHDVDTELQEVIGSGTCVID